MRAPRLAVALLVAVAALGGALGGLSVYADEKRLSVGTVELSVQPFHRGALDVYVPLVDWGARFHAVRLPARLSVDVRSVDRAAARRVAQGDLPDVEAVRGEATDALAAYIRTLVAVVLAASLVAGIVAAFALRGRFAPRLPWMLATAGAVAVAAAAAVALLLPPRGEISDPEYYANGPDIPAALRTIEQATDSARTISEELNGQLVGLARLVADSSGRAGLDPLPRLNLASDFHNNLLALPALERAAQVGPLFFAGDLTSSGSPLEASLVRRVVRLGDPFVFVTGNHDSDVLARRLAGAGAVVLTERGRLREDGSHGEQVADVAGLRVAGYSDPFERRRSNGYQAERPPLPTEAQQERFADWLRPLVGRVDAVMVHSPLVAAKAMEELRAEPPRRPFALLVGHTHEPAIAASENLLQLNGGTAGGGGTGNLEKNQPFGVAVLTYEDEPRFLPVAADTVQIDARTGSATAERRRLEGDL